MAGGPPAVSGLQSGACSRSQVGPYCQAQRVKGGWEDPVRGGSTGRRDRPPGLVCPLCGPPLHGDPLPQPPAPSRKGRGREG